MTSINLKVIDLSHYNPVTNWGAVKAAGIVGVILKATQGAGMVDVTYASNFAQARAAGLLVGAYHFNTGENVQAQVGHFLSVAKPDAQTLLALDFEDNPSSNMSLPQAKEFLLEVESRVGRAPILYSGNRVKDLLGNTKDEVLSSFRLWLAQYGPVPRPQTSWTAPWLWQFSDGEVGPWHAPVPGVRGYVDLNSYAGTDEQLAKEWA